MHILQEAKEIVLTGGLLRKHVDVISSLDSEQHRSPWASSLCARVDLRRDHQSTPSTNSFRPRWRHLRTVYRAAAFNLTLIKHFKCSYRNRVTNPNSTLLTECRRSLQNLVSHSFYGQSCAAGLHREAAKDQAAEVLCRARESKGWGFREARFLVLV